MEFFQALAQQPGIRLRVLHCCDYFPTRPFSLGNPWFPEPLAFEHVVLPGYDFRLSRSREFYINPVILDLVAHSGPNEVWLLGGHTIPTVQLAMWALTARRQPWVLVTEPPKVRSPVRDWCRDMLLLPFKLGARGAILYGSQAKARYFDRFFPPDRIFVTPQYQNLAPLRAIPRPPPNGRPLCFFYAGQLEPYSGVETVVGAFDRLARRHANLRLELLGHGSQRSRLELLLGDDARTRVVFHGAVPREEVPGKFARGDVFVNANRGQGWGMAINEALAAGMPVIASRAIGAAEELVQDGVNGFLLDSPYDEDGYLRSMEFFAQHPDRLPDFVAEARRTADSITLEAGAAGLVAILDKLLGGRA
jgi:glycosyltransferase involved in cell wall biosynthesis